jgi:hypothetical protein
MGVLNYLVVFVVGGTLAFLLVCTLVAEAIEELSEKGRGPREVEVVSQDGKFHTRTDG